ncbi:hypothetical protein [Chryseobacterium camelliae]|uniref:hypothetical protein n=1 Tax=Chryseobacterium camelliae TaxID=1265445 RepID=UPI00285F2303|nr:hypothetical protein [Chryseobacterium camelliae]MDR6514453.1 hypothetical protein [Chryseobacterium camelliae]
MNSIQKEIIIGKKVEITKSSFVNEEIASSAEVKFTCCQCSHLNSVIIKPYESGFPIFQLYHENRVLSRNELLKNDMARKTSYHMLHLGEITVNDLPTLYLSTDCKNCSEKYLVIFSYGEKQPGLEILQLSGIWNYTLK